MGNCWSCGAPVGGARYVFTCPACTETAVMKDIRGDIRGGMRGQESAMAMIASGLSQVADKVSGVAGELSTLAGIVQGGFDELNWELQQQTQILLSIDATLKSPSQTQAREWREMAEQLRSRGCFDDAEKWFLKSLETSPLDFRTYVGLAMNHLRKNDFDKAEEVLKRSFPHAPQSKMRKWPKKTTIEDIADLRKTMTSSEVASLLMEDREAQEEPVLVFDYKSLSHRLIGRICACRGDYGRATAELQSALDLSPGYPEGNYDYALYCVQSGETGGFEVPLRRAISAQPGYLNVARAERRFAPARQELKNLLSGLWNEAYRNAGQAIHDAEVKFADAQHAVAFAPTNAGLEAQVKTIAALLATAKSAWASKDYVKMLKVPGDATRAETLACQLAQQAKDCSIEFSQEKERRQRKALKGIPGAIGRIVGLAVFLFIVCGIGGSVVGVIAHHGQGGTYGSAGYGLGALFGIIWGVIWGIREYSRKLEGKE